MLHSGRYLHVPVQDKARNKSQHTRYAANLITLTCLVEKPVTNHFDDINFNLRSIHIALHREVSTTLLKSIDCRLGSERSNERNLNLWHSLSLLAFDPQYTFFLYLVHHSHICTSTYYWTAETCGQATATLPQTLLWAAVAVVVVGRINIETVDEKHPSSPPGQGSIHPETAITFATRTPASERLQLPFPLLHLWIIPCSSCPIHDLQHHCCAPVEWRNLALRCLEPPPLLDIFTRCCGWLVISPAAPQIARSRPRRHYWPFPSPNSAAGCRCTLGQAMRAYQVWRPAQPIWPCWATMAPS